MNQHPTYHTTNAFYAHIRLLWNFPEDDCVPAPPDHSRLQVFYQHFASTEEIQAVVDSPIAAYLIPPKDVITLQEARLGRQKLRHGIVNIKESFVYFIRTTLPKLGIARWCPDLNEAPDSLLNEACRISAIITF
ncbi:hypothetical protein O181_015628 [Austropuccinia psidii MF-1]|uniref:Uncharacterized protein n=1 Tax=Austropuccinia psidii MF-1 TaxID=1389203 RepID=A0A9Q3GQ54_9BASI|nr:hypothetical protein [Austropuccinia psidii MF-1]